MGPLKKGATQRLRFIRCEHLKLLLGFYMCNSNPLPLGDVRLGRKIFAQRPVNIRRMSALPLNEVRIVRIHGANHFAQTPPGGRVNHPTEMKGLLDHLTGPLREFLKFFLR